MAHIWSRRRFLHHSGAFSGAVLLVNHASALAQSPAPAAPPPAVRPKPAPLAADLVQQFVRHAHGNLDATRQMLDEQPALLNASWDWGGGDFEMAIGGAGHMGRRDIAELLLARGARMDLFVATMLGRLEIVKATLTAYPALVESRGPHGLSLMHHARKGEEGAAEVLRYLQSLGTRER